MLNGLLRVEFVVEKKAINHQIWEGDEGEIKIEEEINHHSYKMSWKHKQ